MQHFSFLLLTLITLFHSPFNKAQLIPLEAYSALPSLSLLRISPDGDRIAYRSLVKDEDYLIIKDIKSGKIVGGFNLQKIKPTNAYFVDQDRVIVIASAYKKIHGFRDKHNISSAFIYDINTKEVQQLLVPGREIFRGQTGLGQVVGFSPDNKYAYMPAYVGKDSDRPKYHLMQVNLEKPRKIKVHKRGKPDTIDYFVEPTGKPLARERYNNLFNIHAIESFIDDEWVEIFREETDVRLRSFVGLTPDYKSLVMIASPDGEHEAYYTMSLADGSISEPLFKRADTTINHVITDNQRVVYGVRFAGFKPEYAFFDSKVTATMEAIQKALPNNSFNIVDYTPDWKKILLYMQGDQSPGDYYLFENGEFTFVTSARPDIQPEQVANVREYNVQARDGLVIPTLLTYPTTVQGQAKDLPAILMPHGGPRTHDTISFNWMAQYFASKGFLVIQPQFRGSTGFGVDFTLKGDGEWGKKMQDDLSDAVLQLIKEGVIDKDKTCIVGWSYGGYAALAGAVFTPELYRCVISINGVSDLNAMMRTEKRNYGEDHWVLSYWNQLIANETISDDYFELVSPINFVDKVTAPILLIHAENDKVVPFTQSSEMADALEDADKLVEFIEIENEGHSIDNSNPSRHSVLMAIDNFLKKHLEIK